MNITHNAELLDRLAAAYALGTLRGGARRRFETVAREHASARAAVLLWQGRLASMTELQSPNDAPSPAVWQRIDNLVQLDKEQAAMAKARRTAPAAAGAASPSGWWGNLTLWRTASTAGAVSAVLAIVTTIGVRDDLSREIGELRAQLQAPPALEYVAVLNDDRAGAAMLVTIDPGSNRLTLQRVSGFEVAADKSLQLWALPRSGVPHSLGVLTQEPTLQLAIDGRDVREVPTLAISLEPSGGVPSETGPTGPVLFKGTLIQKML